MNKMGELIKLLRIKNGYTQKDLADKLHVTPQTVSKWELGTSEPNIDMLLQIANLYQVKIDDLIKGEFIQVRKQINTEFILVGIIYFIMLVLALTIPFIDFLVLKYDFKPDLFGNFDYSIPVATIELKAKLNDPFILSLLIFNPILQGLLLKFDKKGTSSFIISILTSIVFVVFILPIIASPS